MSAFTTPLIVEAVGTEKIFWIFEKTIWEVKEDFSFYLDQNDGLTIHIKKGFRTDFASIPFIFWSILPPYHPDYGKASVLHDALYRTQFFSKAKTEEIFNTAMIVLKAPNWKRSAIYNAVKYFGHKTWNAYKNSDMLKARELCYIT